MDFMTDRLIEINDQQSNINKYFQLLWRALAILQMNKHQGDDTWLFF